MFSKEIFYFCTKTDVIISKLLIRRVILFIIIVLIDLVKFYNQKQVCANLGFLFSLYVSFTRQTNE
jgi:hypothetical protein